jgi:large repetitive protein
MTNFSTMKKRIFTVLLSTFLLLLGQTAFGQTDPSQPHQVCQEAIEPYQVDYADGPTGTPGSTYAWTLSVGTATIVSGNGTNAIVIDWGLTPPGLYSAAISVTETNAGCPGTPVTLDVEIIELEAAVTAGVSPVCPGEDAVFTFTGTPNAVVAYELNGTPATVTLDGSGNATVTVTAITVDQTIDLVSVSNGTCTYDETGTATVAVSPELPATVAPSVTPICFEDDAVFTFTGPSNGTISYTLNGSPATISLDGSGNATLTLTAVSIDQVVDLVSVTNGSCSNPVTGSATIVVQPELNATVAPSASPICYEDDAVFTFTGPANGTVSYTLNGTPATISLDGSGNATLTITAATTTQTVVITAVADASCSNPETGTADVVVQPELNATVAAATTPICFGQDAVFNFTGPANGSIDYTLNGTPATISLDGSGNAALTITGAAVDQTIVITAVSDGTCSNPETGTATVVVLTELPATVAAVTTPICEGEDAVFSFTGPSNGSIDYTLNGSPATINLDGSGNGTLTISGATTTQQVDLVSVSNGSCDNPVTGTASVVVNPLPTTSPIFHN